MTESTEDYVRECEKVIDTGYSQLPIMRRPQGAAIYGALAAFDLLIVSKRLVFEASGGAPMSVGQIQHFKSQGEGLVWALRWLLKPGPPVDAVGSDDEKLLSDAAKLLVYGSKYFSVSVMYSQFSRKMMVASVDQANRVIRFDHAPGFYHANSGWGIHDEVSNANSRRHSSDQEYLSQIYTDCVRAIYRIPHHYESGRIVLDDVCALTGPHIRKWCDHLSEQMHSYPHDTDVMGFTLEQFNSFWAALISWSVAVSELYIAAFYRRVPQETCMPTQVVSRDVFVNRMGQLTKLDKDIIEAIIARLTFDFRTEKPDIHLQPLVCGPDFVAWSAAIVQLSGFQRNLLKLMSRTKATKNCSDRIIGNREGELVAKLRTMLEAKGWTAASNRKFRVGGEDAEVDLLATNWAHPDEVLVVEAKAFLHADDINEIRAATKEMQHAQEQVTRAIRMIRAMSVSERRTLFPNVEWEKVVHWYGLVVTPETEPGINYDHSKVPACSIGTMAHRLTAPNWRGPFGLWRALVNREWQSFLREPVFRYEPMRLAGITFELPFIKLPDEEVHRQTANDRRSQRRKRRK